MELPASGNWQWYIRNVTTGAEAGSHLTGVITSDIPAGSTALGPVIWRNNGTTALAVNMQFNGMKVAYSLE